MFSLDTIILWLILCEMFTKYFMWSESMDFSKISVECINGVVIGKHFITYFTWIQINWIAIHRQIHCIFAFNPKTQNTCILWQIIEFYVNFDTNSSNHLICSIHTSFTMNISFTQSFINFNNNNMAESDNDNTV